jgi:hypothetical protein
MLLEPALRYESQREVNERTEATPMHFVAGVTWRLVGVMG